MITKYYVATRPQTNENHSVHKEDCPFLPDDEKRIYLGMFGSGRDAVKEGERHFKRTNSCLFCSKEINRKKRQPLSAETVIIGDIPANNGISPYQNCTALYFLN